MAAGAAVPAFALSTSAFTMRPLGPEPVTPERSMPFCSAMRFANGDAMMRSPELAGAEAAGARAGSALSRGAALAGSAGASAFSSSFAGAASAAAPPPAGATLPASSPSSAKVAITVPTATPSVPSSTWMCAITPSSTASNSIVALSVSISAMMSPAETLSPTFTSHLARVPSSIVGESAGILMAIGMGEAGSLMC